jgi:periplasmic copper chaperone A
MGLLNRCFAAAALAALPAAAHVVLERPSAEAGTFYKGTFMVGHGCTGGSPTVAVTVRFPAEIATVKPGMKPGWTIELKREPIDKPYDSYGKRVTDRVAEVTWKGGSLPFDYYDEFMVQMRLPDTPGKRYFTVKQTCENGALEWNEIPEAGKTRRDYKQPAAELDVVPKKAPEAGAEHRH